MGCKLLLFLLCIVKRRGSLGTCHRACSNVSVQKKKEKKKKSFNMAESDIPGTFPYLCSPFCHGQYLWTKKKKSKPQKKITKKKKKKKNVL